MPVHYLRGRCYYAVYVDDIVLTGRSDGKINMINQTLRKQFQIKDIGELHYFLGVNVVQDLLTGNVWIGQQTYMQNILRKYNMEDCKTIQTPVDSSSKLAS